MLTRRVFSPVAMTRPFPIDREIDRLFSGFFADAPAWFSQRGAPAFPALNAWEDEQALHIEAELPGFAMSDLDITLNGRTLTIAGSRNESPAENASFHRRERPQGRFTRTLTLNTDIDADKVSATLERGVLGITLPKAEAVKPRKIEVRTA